MVSRFAAVNKQRNITNNHDKLFPAYTKKMTKFGLEALTGKPLSVWLQFSDETVETFLFQYKYKLGLA